LRFGRRRVICTHGEAPFGDFDTNAGSTLNATVRAEVHDAINDIVAATGGNYELGIGFYERVQQSETALLDLVYLELKSLSVAAQCESFLYKNDRIWLSDSLFNGHYPEARASVVVHEASHVKHKAASLTN
jgi:Zn-dependent protease with chaperone function